ncbi:MAG: hypothetical protein P1U46_00730 [Patescibacteria group bacterium]|nr:hypothetical protein [Patescibacteria group bacterium]
MEFKNREDYENSKIYFTEKECPFCSKQLNKTNKILFETNYWTVVYNKYPYF